MLETVEVHNSRGLREFIDLPYRLYRNDPNFVPPLRSQTRDMLKGKGNILLDRGPHTLLLCRRDGEVVGRLMTGIDEAYNRQNNCTSAWISLFECTRDPAAAESLFRECADWAIRHGADTLRGPESPDNSDSYRGILVMGFDGPPALLNNYNPPWYGEFFENFGFVKTLDLFAYTFSAAQILEAKKEQVILYAMHRYAYHVDNLDLRHLNRDLHDIHEVLIRTIPMFEGEHMALPTFEDVEKLAGTMLQIADPELICIARTDNGGQPIGLVVALPDYNLVFRHIRDGRLFPTGIFKLLYYRRKINAARVFMQFVVPEFQGKAVNNAIFYTMCKNAMAKGYVTGDGSAIGETNIQSRASIERMGGIHYRTYRTYTKKVGEKE